MHNVTADACVNGMGGPGRAPKPSSGYSPVICASVHPSEVGGEGPVMGNPPPWVTKLGFPQLTHLPHPSQTFSSPRT